MQAKHQQVQNLENLYNDRVLPTCIEVEEQILGGIMIDPTAIVRVSPLISTHEVFSIDSHQKIWLTCTDLHGQGGVVDLMTVSHELLNRNWLDKIGGQSKLAQLVDRTVSAINIDKYAELAIEKWTKRRTIKMLEIALKEAYAPSTTTEEVLDDLGGQVQKIKADMAKDGGSIEHSSTIAVQLMEEKLAIEAGLSERMLKTGFYDFDAVSGGLPVGSLTVFIGRGGMAKTTTSLNVAYNVATAGGTVAIFSREMTKGNVMDKVLSIQTQISGDKLIQPKQLNQGEWGRLVSAASNMNLPIWINDRSELTLQEIRNDLRTLQEISPTPIKLVIVDYIGLMCNSGDVLEIDSILKGLRAIAKDFNVVLLGLAQIGKEIENRNDKRPTGNDGKGTSGIRASAATLIGIHRDDYDNPNSPDKGILELIVLKNRFGREGVTVKLLFRPECSRIENLKGRN